MVQVFAERYNKVLALFFLSLFYSQFVMAAHIQLAYQPFAFPNVERNFLKHSQGSNGFDETQTQNKQQHNDLKACTAKLIESIVSKEDIGGPTQPETQSFQSVNSNNMVDMFSGDFSYNIPLMDVGGYPVNISYRSGITMDQEASWVGLGWNINPGSVTRNMRGLPDDFNGTDSITKTMSIKENKTVGVTVGYDLEIIGYPKEKGGQTDSSFTANLSLGASFGVNHNSYKGWGVETSMNASIGAGSSGTGGLTAGLGLTNSSQDGVTVSPNFSIRTKAAEMADKNTLTGNVGISLPYNTRSGLKALQISGGLSQGSERKFKNSNDPKGVGASSVFSSGFSFINPTYTPSIQIPYTNSALTFTVKVGSETKTFAQSLFVSGYVSKQKISDEDKKLSLPAYGYLNYQNAVNKPQALLDFNREKDIPYREKPALPTIAVPSYTYDAFTISGEGTGGMFRAYRSDIGYVSDPQMQTKDNSARISGDLGFGDLTKAGIDLNLTRAYTQTGAWTSDNMLASTVQFRKPNGTFEASYFRNPGEKTINDKALYDTLGGDEVVTAEIFQSKKSDPLIRTTNSLLGFKNKNFVKKSPLQDTTAIKRRRDKRTQVITYLTADEASTAGLSKYIENYTINKWGLKNCGDVTIDNVYGDGNGLLVEYFDGKNFEQKKNDEKPTDIKDIDNSTNLIPKGLSSNENYSVRWTGRIKPEVTGAFTFQLTSDDGARLFLNDSIIINSWTDHSQSTSTGTAKLVAGELYNLRLEYYNHTKNHVMKLRWTQNGVFVPIPLKDLYLMPTTDTFPVSVNLSKEKRVNSFRKANHLSEIDVLNADGRKYVYGLPVYNLKQRENNFSVKPENADKSEGLVSYSVFEDSVANPDENNRYFLSEEIPAYAHSFLLTGILSSDYVDITGDGISDDDLGDAVRFNYSKVAGIQNPYAWRAPYTNKATYNEGLRTDYRDDKGSYVYGEKELWYLHSIQSKNMIATFKVSDRKDLVYIDGRGIRDTSRHYAKKLDEINLYTKAAFLKDSIYAKPVKTVHLEYTYELCKGTNLPADSGKLTLKRIWFSYNGNNNKGKKNPYVFVYNSNNPDYNLKSYDRWGNYKDPLQNPGSTAGNVITNAEYPYALQDSVLAAKNAAAWTLDSIALPSGGRMKVTYESDDYGYVQNRRASQMTRIIGFARNKPTNDASIFSNSLYSGIDPLNIISQDNLYVGVRVSTPVVNSKDAFTRYLDKIQKLYFKIYVKMPQDKFGSGYEYVPGYATPDFEGGYGVIGTNILWFKVKGIDLNGSGNGDFSPFAKTAIQFLRLNLPSKAYPGSDTGDDLDLGDAVKVLATQAANIKDLFVSFDTDARIRQVAKDIDTLRSFIRLNSPDYKKMGGGHRVKRIQIYDHWNSMTKQREAIYGQEYTYTTTKEVNGNKINVSSGVATYEPSIGGEENPWHNPIEYNEQVAPLAPVAMGYVEEPMGESFFPAASVGYSKVRVRSINTTKKKSANGFEEMGFYTSYDFPTITDRTIIDVDTKKRFKPALSSFLKINARHYLTVSQGFKIELNDMNGKVRYQATYPEIDTSGPISYTENFYKVDNAKDEFKHLNNVVMAIRPDGTIDSAAVMGKDVELMMDMREEKSVTNGNNFNVNVDAFTFSMPPVFALPSLLSLAQREENRYRSIATTKVIQRYGILDSIVIIDKGSKVVTENVLFDGETGEPVLTRTQNEFDDSVYNFTYPSHWAYNILGGAYQNIGTVLDHINIYNGKATGGLAGNEASYFVSGDEAFVYSRSKIAGSECTPLIATFPGKSKIWAIDTSLNGGPRAFYFIDANGKPFTGYNISLKLIRSGKRNMIGSVGAVSMLANPVVKSGSTYALKIDSTMRIINASAVEYRQIWNINDRFKRLQQINCTGPIFWNIRMSKSFGKNDCDSNSMSVGSVTYVVDSNMYSSTISQLDANQKAQLDLDYNGQAFANDSIHCQRIYYNVEKSKTFTKNNCSSGLGSSFTYTVAARTDSSLTSQEIADQKAQSRIDLKGQDSANKVGTCCSPYFSWASGLTGVTTVVQLVGDTVTFTLVPSNYPATTGTVTLGWLTGSCCFPASVRTVPYTSGGTVYNLLIYPDGKVEIQYMSGPLPTTSPGFHGVFNLRANGFYSVVKTGNYTRNNCAPSQTGSTVPYTVSAYLYYSTVSQVDADLQAQYACDSLGQLNANATGSCSSPCSFSWATAITNGYSKSFSATSNTVLFTVVFMAPYANYTGGTVGTITGGCLPSTTKTFTMADGATSGRQWNVTITPAGLFSIALATGSPATTTGAPVTLYNGVYTMP